MTQQEELLQQISAKRKQIYDLWMEIHALELQLEHHNEQETVKEKS